MAEKHLTGFGQLIRNKRKDMRLTVESAAGRIGISKQYLSVLEREAPSQLTGKPITPKVELVDRIASTLGLDLNEARLAAGYAPTTTTARPQTIPELIEALERLGIEAPQLYGGMPADPDGEGFREIVERIWLDVNLVVSRLQKGRKVNYIPIPIAITEEVDSIPNADTLPFVKAK